MIPVVTHPFVSAEPVGGDPAKVNSDDWNDQHTIAWATAVPNNQTVAADGTLAAGKNYLTAGPITINDGVTVTVADTAEWVIV